jgi:hypothetical protein
MIVPGATAIYVHFYSSIPLKWPFNVGFYYPDATNLVALYVSISIAIFVFIFCSLCFYRCSKTYLRNRNNRMGIVEIQINQNNNILNPLQRSPQDLLKSKNIEIIQKLFENEFKGREYTDELNDYKIFVCSICLDTLVGSLVSKLDCKHVFHTHCLKDWLLKDALKPKCPNCNHPVIENPNESQSILINPNPDRENIAMLVGPHVDGVNNVVINPVTVVIGRPINI